MPTDFQLWMARQGLHGKEVSKAASMIGIESTATASRTFRGDRELSMTERLAMAAIRAGLPPWTPGNDAEIADVAEFKKLLERAADRRPLRDAAE